MTNTNEFWVAPNCCEDAKENASRIDFAIFETGSHDVKTFKFCPYCSKSLERKSTKQA